MYASHNMIFKCSRNDYGMTIAGHDVCMIYECIINDFSNSGSKRDQLNQKILEKLKKVKLEGNLEMLHNLLGLWVTDKTLSKPKAATLLKNSVIAGCLQSFDNFTDKQTKSTWTTKFQNTIGWYKQ